VFKKLQNRHVEVAIQTEGFDHRSKSSNNDRRIDDAATVVSLTLLDEQILSASLLLHRKIPELKTVAITTVDHTPELKELKACSSKRIKEFWKNVRECKLGVAYLSSLIERPKDARPFLPIRLLNRTVYGLLDSGAAISCVGGQLACEVLDKYDYKTITANAATADGRSQQIVGRLKLDIGSIDDFHNTLTEARFVFGNRFLHAVRYASKMFKYFRARIYR